MIRLNLTNDQFAVIYEFLLHTKLGDTNRFEVAISDFMIDAEADFVDDLMSKIDRPKIKVIFSDEDGLTFELEE